MSGTELAALGDRFLNLHEVKAKTGLSAATIYRQIAKRRFPDRTMLGENTARWRLSEIDAWMRSLGPLDQPIAKV